MRPVPYRVVAALSLQFLAVAATAAIPGWQGSPGSLCPLFVIFTASDGCSTCMCFVDGRMTGCSREACPEPRGNYTINECVENELYLGNDGCNRCQCNAFRSFSHCTKEICLESRPGALANPPPVRQPLAPPLGPVVAPLPAAPPQPPRQNALPVWQQGLSPRLHTAPAVPGSAGSKGAGASLQSQG